MGIAEEEDTEGAVAKEEENKQMNPSYFTCALSNFLTTVVLCQVGPPFVPCSATGQMYLHLDSPHKTLYSPLTLTSTPKVVLSQTFSGFEFIKKITNIYGTKLI
jgi:hypothetical protein